MSNKDIAVFCAEGQDLAQMKEGLQLLERFSVSFHTFIASPHSNPEYLSELIRQCEIDQVQLVIAASGGAAHLAGVLAGRLLLPVIGVPLETGSLQGMDALLSTAMMPPHMPVATMGIGPDAGTNACMHALRILALQRPALREQLTAQRRELHQSVRREAEILEKQGWKKYKK
jgi:phosphoribosylaminoimidazole carboxylase PurE protein